MGATIRVRAIDGTWQTLGTGKYRGVVAEGIEATSNGWGPDQLSFNLKTVEPAALRPDLLPYTPVDLEVDGLLVWSGRVKNRPASERDHNVQCEGWQYHLDDDVLDRKYVHTRLSEWVDFRANLACTTLGRVGTAAGQVNATDMGIVISWPKAAQINTSGGGAWCGVMLDLGQDSTCKRFYVAYEKISATATSGIFNYVIRGSDVPDVTGVSGGTSEDILSTDITGLSASGANIGTFTTARRYLGVFLHFVRGSDTTLGEDNTLRIPDIKVFRDTAYESSNLSVLKADTVVKDVLSYAPDLNQSTDLITVGTFNIPAYSTQSYQSPREIVESVNAYENYRTKIGGGDLRTVVFDPKQTSAIIEAGEWSGSQFADSSVSGDDLYSKVVVTGTGPDGAPIVGIRGHGHGTTQLQMGGMSPGSMTEIGGTFRASGNLAGGAVAYDGIPYEIRWRLRTTSGTLAGTNQSVQVGWWDGGTFQEGPLHTGVAWSGTGAYTIDTWMPLADRTSFGVTWIGGSFTGTGTAVIDMDLYWGGSLLERQGIPRARVLPISSPMTQQVAERFGDLWLTDHRTSPFSGKLTITTGIRRVLGGATVPAHELLIHAGNRIRLSHRVDPDYGTWGRDGYVAAVRYAHDQRQAEIDVDDRRDHFESILARYGILVDQFG